MDISTNAEVYIPSFAEDLTKRINKSILRKIEKDLDTYEKVSILFLMVVDYASSFKEIYNLYNAIDNPNRHVLVDFVEAHPKFWQHKVLEAIGIIKNRSVIWKLGIEFSEIELRYSSHICGYSMFVNEVAKTLYMFCESLSTKQMQLLLKYIREDNGPSDHRLKNVPFLELHILYWAHVGYISTKAGNRWDLTNLLKHLKKLQLTDKSIYGQLEKHKFITTDQWTEILNNDSKSPSPEKEINQPNKNEPVSVANGGLCFIINQMYFPETQYETRYGTDRDRDRLSDTFKQFGFDIEIHNDLTEEEILSALRGIGKKFDKKYNCLVLCILSHGHEDSIISTDGKEIPVAKIESEICCDKLLNVVKVVIIQACREKMSGSAVRDAIIRIGDQDSEAYADFFLFSSTMHGFISCRHKIYGSWFIQTFCKELIFGTKNGGTLLECAASTTKKVITMVKQNGIGRSMPQLPEQRNRLRTHEFKFTYYPNVSV